MSQIPPNEGRLLRYQCLVLTSLVGLYFGCIWLVWVGAYPELELSEFSSKAQAIGLYASLVVPIVAVVLYLIGWDPRTKILKSVREWFVRQSTDLVRVKRLFTVLLFLTVLEFIAIYRLYDPPPGFVQLAWQSDFDGARAADRTEFFFANAVIDASEARYLANTGQLSEWRCKAERITHLNAGPAFASVWKHAAYEIALGDCLTALGRVTSADGTYARAERAAARLGTSFEDMARRRRALLYMFHDAHNKMRFRDSEDRLNHVEELIEGDDSAEANRIRGSVLYLRNQLQDALAVLRSSLRTLRNPIDRKRVYNNMALAYLRLNQPGQARTSVRHGLGISFDRRLQVSRREQIRLLATATLVDLREGRCQQALETWDRRVNLEQNRPASGCQYLLQAMVHACGALGGPVLAERRADVREDLRRAFGEAEIELTTAAHVDPILIEATNRFVTNTCYVGLEFDSASVRAALLSP